MIDKRDTLRSVLVPLKRLLFWVFFGIYSTCVFAAVPSTLRLEVALSDDGTPIEGEKAVRVTIYDSTANNPLWTEQILRVPFTQGNATLTIGESLAIPDSLFLLDGLYFGVRVNQKEIKIPIISVPHVIRSQDAQQARSIEGVSAVVFNDAARRVGIGTQSPQARLDVNGAIRISQVRPEVTLSDGIIQWNGVDFFFRKNNAWVSMTYKPNAIDESKWRLAGTTIYADSAENVGMGTSVPQARLDVNGSASVSGTVNAKENVEVLGDIVVNQQYRLRSTGAADLDRLYVSTANYWATGNMVFSGVLTGDGSGLTNLGADAFSDNAFLPANIVDASVVNGKLASGSVTTAKLPSSVLPLSKFALGFIGADQLADGTLTSANVIDASVTPEKVSLGAVTTDDVKPLTREKISTGAITAEKIALAAIYEEKIADAAVESRNLADAVITGGKIDQLQVSTRTLAPGSISEFKLSGFLPISVGGTGSGQQVAKGVLHVADVSGETRLVTDPNTFHWANASGHLGVGTNVPAHRFHVADTNGGVATLLVHTTATADVGVALKHGVTRYEIVNRKSRRQFEIGSGPTPNVAVGVSGNVGIGTATPSARLHIEGALTLGGASSTEEGALQYDGTHLMLRRNGAWVPVSTRFGGISQGTQNVAVDGGGGEYNAIGGGQGNTITLFNFSAKSSIIGGGQSHVASGDYHVIGGGQSNAVQVSHAFVGGGRDNGGISNYAIVGGGRNNTSLGSYSAIFGGAKNLAPGNYAVIAGGTANAAIGNHSTVGGGRSNSVSGAWSTIVGGSDNVIGFSDSKRVKGGDANGSFISALFDRFRQTRFAFIGTGHHNEVKGTNGMVLSGNHNRLEGADSALLMGRYQRVIGERQYNVLGRHSVLQGRDNVAVSAFDSRTLGTGNWVGVGEGISVLGDKNQLIQSQSSVIDGDRNILLSGHSHRLIGADHTVAAGDSYRLSGNGHILAGGTSTIVSGKAHVVVGASDSRVSGEKHVLIAGGGHELRGQGSLALGGQSHQVEGEGAMVLGGTRAHVSGKGALVIGGETNRATGRHSLAIGGRHNVASGEGSVAMGTGSKARHEGSFVWSDASASAGESSDHPFQFKVRARGGVLLMTGDGQIGAVLEPGSGSWSHVSDKHKKTDFSPVSEGVALSSVRALPLQTWAYKTQKGIKHIGPYAQDFHRLFKLGDDKRRIYAVDADGVAFAAMKDLIRDYRSYEQLVSELSVVSRASELSRWTGKLIKQQRQLANLTGKVASVQAKLKALEDDEQAQNSYLEVLKTGMRRDTLTIVAYRVIERYEPLVQVSLFFGILFLSFVFASRIGRKRS